MINWGGCFKMFKNCLRINFCRIRKFDVNEIKRQYSAGGCQKKGAIVLAGSGFLDGTSIHEAAAVALHLSKQNIKPVFYAPCCPQTDVVDHQKQCPVAEKRQVLTESARIARGCIENLCHLQCCDASCVIFPGGFGVAKTLSTFDQDRAGCAINGDVMRVMEDFHDARKPMGFICIAAVLPARMFPCVKVTLGMKGNPEKWPYQYAIDCASQMGAEVEVRDVDGFSFDKQHMVFSTPAFMYAGTFAQVSDGIGYMITEMCKYLE